MSWAKWDLEHRSNNVRVSKSATGGLKVMSGGKHLGNIEHRNGRHVSVIKKSGDLKSAEHASAQDALDHIRQAHGLPKGGALDSENLLAGLGKPGTPRSSAQSLAEQIRRALAHPGPSKTPEVSSTRSRTSGSTISRAEGSRSVARHNLKADFKRPAPVKGEKDRADSVRTTIRMAEYNRKKRAGGGVRSADKVAASVNKAGPGEFSSPHEPGTLEHAVDKANHASRMAEANPTPETHEAARTAHADAAWKATKAKNDPANTYHLLMARHHGYAAKGEPTRGSLGESHSDAQGALFNNDPHHLMSLFSDTEARRQADQHYDSIRNAADSGLTKTQLSAVKTYTGNAFSKINDHLRGSKTITDPAARSKVEKTVSDLDAAMSKQEPLAHDMVTYRGVKNADQVFGSLGSHVGGEFADHAFTSTTTHGAVSNEFSHEAVVRVLNRQGQVVLKPHDAGAFGNASADFRELTVPRDTRYHVAADRMVTLHDGTSRRVIDLVRK